MSPLAMLALIVAANALFGWSAMRRWNLLRAGRSENRFDRIGERLRVVWRYAFAQEKMDYYQPAGIAHKLIFVGFIVLLANTIILWGRGFSPAFNLFVFQPWTVVGRIYEFAKDSVAILVMAGVAVFFYYRVLRPLKRMSKSSEAILILGIIFTMMVADLAYNGAMHVLAARKLEMCGSGAASIATAAQCARLDIVIAPLGDHHVEGVEAIAWSPFPAPGASLLAVWFKNFAPGTLLLIAQIGFWTHSSLVLIFLNLLPHSKHFHVITGIPNVFFTDLSPPGRLRPLAESTEKLMEKVTAASEAADPFAVEGLGVGRVEQLTWKSILDFYTCTECGRCSDNCPAHLTGKILSPKHFTLDLRNHLYGREDEIIAAEKAGKAARNHGKTAENDATIEAKAEADGHTKAIAIDKLQKINLSPDVIHPDVLWACTTCRACEEQCPVFISYVDKIVDMRRNLQMIRGEFPHELQKPFQGMETNGNPWNLSRMDRAAWSDGLAIPTFADNPKAEVLYWVCCSASCDDRAKKVARATAKLLKMAKVDFAILAQEENCTGDPARRAGNEVLFMMLAEGNVATLNGYKDQGGMKTVVTACPHCFNTLKNEYPDLGAKLEVVHHTDFLLGLLAEGRLHPVNEARGKVVYHDSCYLGRYNEIYESPREILKRIPGVELVEAEYWNRQRGLCCGAGGAQVFMEEQNTNRMNVKRTLQLLDTGAKTVASGCPFCALMLTDGIKSQELEEQVKQLDVAEILEMSCSVVEKAKPDDAPLSPPPEKIDEPAAATA
ncbi:(Fe-S)-binding protein [soil metagenome]